MFLPLFMICLSAGCLSTTLQLTWHRNVSRWFLETQLGSNVKVTSHENIIGVGLCTLVSDGFFSFHIMYRCYGTLYACEEVTISKMNVWSDCEIAQHAHSRPWLLKSLLHCSGITLIVYDNSQHDINNYQSFIQLTTSPPSHGTFTFVCHYFVAIGI